MLKIKDNVDLKELINFGFRPKYNEDTGAIERYILEEQKWRQNELNPDIYLRVEIAKKSNINTGKPFKCWWEITYIELDFIDTLYDLIKADLVEKV